MRREENETKTIMQILQTNIVRYIAQTIFCYHKTIYYEIKQNYNNQTLRLR